MQNPHLITEGEYCEQGRNLQERTFASKLVECAIAKHENGQLIEAEKLYAQVLHLEPTNADALHFSGLLAHQKGNSQLAVDLMKRSIEIDARRYTFHVNMGMVLEAVGDCVQAVESYRLACLIDPAVETAHHRLGDLLLRVGEYGQAAFSLGRALAILPESPETINSLAVLLQRLGRPEQSVVFCMKAIKIEASYAHAHNNLGLALHALGRLDEAIESCRQAIRNNPSLAAAHSNLGSMLTARRAFVEATDSCRRAIELDPFLAEAHLNLGNAYRGQGLLERSIGSYEKAIQLAPHLASGHNNLAESYKDQDRLEEAVEAFQTGLQVDAGSTATYSNLLYLYAFTRHCSPEVERLLAKGWEECALTESARGLARQRSSPHFGTFPVRSNSRGHLRIGIVSAELGSHAVADFLEPFLEEIDRSRFHLTLFPTMKRTCARARYFQGLADGYIPLIGLSDSDAADRIRREKIDVLMDTTGHTFGGRLGIFAHRAAPVQCTYIGYWSTTGLTEMDWIIADPSFQPSMEAHFTEDVWRLPRFCSCYKGDTSLPESNWTPDPNGTIWLGSFNKYGKIRGDTLSLWAKVLHALPNAKLLLEDSAELQAETQLRIVKTLSQHGISECRVEFVPFIPVHELHMALYDRLDIALDTIPFNSGTTAFDALWMGVPLIALEGNWTGGRMASSALRAFKQDQWVAKDEQEYVDIVCSLARDVDGRIALRKSQRSRMAASPLCNAKELARCLGDAFQGMYDHWIASD